MLKKIMFRGLATAFAAILMTIFPATPALADAGYLINNSSESGMFVNALNDTVSGTPMEYSILNMVPGQIGYFGAPNATSYSKVFPQGNAVAAGSWTLNAWGRSLNASKVVFSAEIGEYTAGGAYNIKIPYGDLPAGFGWTADFKGSNYTLISVTKTGAPAFTLAPGSRLYVKIWAQNTHSTQNRDAFLGYNATGQDTNLGTPPFAQPIPSLGWYITIGLIALFMVFAVRFGVVKLRRGNA